MIRRDALRPACFALFALIAWCASSRPLSAQSADAFARSIVTFTVVQQGTFGDEGPQLGVALDALERSFAGWEREAARARAQATEELRSAPPDRAARVRVALGIEDLRRGQYRAAAEAFDSAAAAGHEDANILRGLVDEAQGRAKEAADVFRRAWERQPANLVAAYKAWQHRLLFDEETRTRLQRAFVDAASRPADVRAVSFPAVALVSDAGAPLLPLAAYAEGYRLLAQHRYADALAQFRAAAAADPLSTERAADTVRLGLAALRDGRRGEARSLLEETVSRTPDSVVARRALGLALWLDDDYRGSIVQLEAAVRLAPRDERARVALARVLVQAERFEDAERVLQQTIDVLPDSASAHWWLSTVYSSLNRDAEALRMLAAPAALMGVTGRGDVYSAISELHEKVADFAGAVAPLLRRAELLPNDPVSHLALARAYVHLDQMDAALVEYVTALALDSRQAPAYVGIGQVHLSGDRLPEAIAALERAVGLQPANAEARYALATALTRASRQAEAAAHLSEYARLQAAATGERRRKMTLDVLREEAAMRASKGEHARSVELWREVIAEEPGLASNHAGLGAALLAAGQVPGAIAAYEQAASRGGAPSVYRELASLYEQVKRPEDARRARESYERALQSLLRPRAVK